ncbi:MAG: hypothetical protein ACTHN5_16175, partial [Phycisphaerae bacterium]
MTHVPSKIASTLLLALAPLALAAPPTTKPAYPPLPKIEHAKILTSEFLYDKAPFPSSHASTIVETTDGTLVASFFGGTRERDPDVCIWITRKINGKWTPLLNAADGVQPPSADPPQTPPDPPRDPRHVQTKKRPPPHDNNVGPKTPHRWGQ